MKHFVLLSALVLAVTACSQGTTTDTTTETSSSSVQSSEAMSEPMVQNSLTFLGKSTLVDHTGGFEDFEVIMTLAHTQPFTDAQIDATIFMDSVYSDSEMLTGHLKKEDFFDTETYPEATFSSTTITETDDPNVYTVKGNLTIKGTTMEITTLATMDEGVMTIEAEVPRKVFNVGNDSYGEKLLAEMVPVTLVYTIEGEPMEDEMMDGEMMDDEVTE